MARDDLDACAGSSPGDAGPEVRDELVEVLDRLLDQAVVLDVVDRRRAELGTQARRPAVVLPQGAGEALVARLREHLLGAVAVGDRDLLELLAEQQLLELGVVLHVALVPART